MMADSLQAMRTALVDAARLAYAEGLFSGTSGNLSVLVDGQMLITPTSVRYEQLRPEELVLMSPDGTVLAGSLPPSSEWRMHAQVYARCPGVLAQVHTHSPYATAYAAARRSIPACLIEMLYFLGGEVPCAAYAPPGTEAVGLRCAEVLPGHGGCLLANHGVLAVGGSLREALLRAEYIEDAAKISLLSMQLGGPTVLSNGLEDSL